MADLWDDKCDYLGRYQSRRLAEALRDRRRQALSAVSRISFQVTTDGKSMSELVFDHPPTLQELVEQAGAGACVVAVGRQWTHQARQRPVGAR